MHCTILTHSTDAYLNQSDLVKPSLAFLAVPPSIIKSLFPSNSSSSPFDLALSYNT